MTEENSDSRIPRPFLSEESPFRPLNIARRQNAFEIIPALVPMSFSAFTQMRFQRQPALKKSPQEVEEKKKTANDGHKFLLQNLKALTDERSQEDIELQKAERTEFVQMMTLATIQDENFQP